MRASLFQINGVKKEPLVLPEPDGMVTTLTEKVYVPVKEHPDVSNILYSVPLCTHKVIAERSSLTKQKNYMNIITTAKTLSKKVMLQPGRNIKVMTIIK